MRSQREKEEQKGSIQEDVEIKATEEPKWPTITKKKSVFVTGFMNNPNKFPYITYYMFIYLYILIAKGPRQAWLGRVKP